MFTLVDAAGEKERYFLRFYVAKVKTTGYGPASFTLGSPVLEGSP